MKMKHYDKRFNQTVYLVGWYYQSSWKWRDYLFGYFDALSLSNQLNESFALKDRIILEENRSGQEFVSTILEAMRDNKMITFCYKPFWMEGDYVSNLFHIEPYALKYFKRRWYLLAKYGDSPLKIYALDRMQDIDIEFESFTMPEDFNAEAFFSSCFGIIVGEEESQQIDGYAFWQRWKNNQKTH